MAGRRRWGDEDEDEEAATRRRDRGCALAALALVGAVVVAAIAVVGVGNRLRRSIDEVTARPTGSASARLDVQVAPHVGLDDGSVVRVTSRAFAPHLVVAVAVCLEEAATDRRGVEACDTGGGSRFATDGSGRLDQAFAVPRVITVDGRSHDCAARAGRCLLVAAEARDLDRSGGVRLTFRTDLPTVDLAPRPARPRSDRLPISATPPGPQPRGTSVAVEASGFRPGEPLLVARCTSAFETSPAEEACEPVGDGGAAAVTVFLVGELPASLPRAGSDGTIRVQVALAREVTAYGSSAPTDCTAAPGRCSIVVGAAADTRRSAVLPYSISG